jgi:group II intron reverse transcriptase/maturase
MMHEGEKSDLAVVAKRPPNKAGGPDAEAVEPRAGAKENAAQRNTRRTQSRENVLQSLDRIRQAAIRDKGTVFTALLHHVTPELLDWAFFQLKKAAAPGVDGVTWDQYEVGLPDKLADLHGRVQRGAYRALPSRRQYIPKPDGRLRPLGVAALEDKIVQRATVAVLNAIYETDFAGFSYGFRPRRSQHDALDALAVGLHRRKVGIVLDADIRAFFDRISHDWLIRFLEHRIGDQRILRLIGKWLKAGVLEAGTWTQGTAGTPQGAVISPLLANVYLHYVYDLWAQQWRDRYAHGDMIVIRYADDTVVGFQHEADARRFLDDLRERLAKFELELHPEKTRLVPFGRHAKADRPDAEAGRLGTFDFLGFTHISAKSNGGKFLLKRQTMRKRMRAKLAEIKEEMRRRLHQRIAEQGRWLRSVVAGYFAYHAVPTNARAISAFRHHVIQMWLKSLRRRSQRHNMPWERMNRIIDAWIPPAVIRHPWPNQRFDVKHPRQEPSALAAHARICAGGAA